MHILGPMRRAPSRWPPCGPTERCHANSLWQQLLVEAGPKDVERALSWPRVHVPVQAPHGRAHQRAVPVAGYRTLYRSLFKDGGICDRDIDYGRATPCGRREDGGLAVLAHPGQLDSYDLLPDLVECGLGGIERFIPTTLADHASLAELVVRYRLVCTSGSDYHGRFGRVPTRGFAFRRRLREPSER
ncbi:MAG: hypothetical protein ACLTMP_10820 [Eggerthella lenta]